MPVGTIHVATACASRSARIDDRARRFMVTAAGRLTPTHHDNHNANRRLDCPQLLPRVGTFGLIGQTTSSRDPCQGTKETCQEFTKGVYQEAVVMRTACARRGSVQNHSWFPSMAAHRLKIQKCKDAVGWAKAARKADRRRQPTTSVAVRRVPLATTCCHIEPGCPMRAAKLPAAARARLRPLPIRGGHRDA
jgi:hypothetical protein